MRRFLAILTLALTDFPRFSQRLRTRLGGVVGSRPAGGGEHATHQDPADIYRQWIAAHHQAPYPARLALDLGPLAAAARGLPNNPSASTGASRR